MRFLVLTSRRIESRQSGYDLRVANLCSHLPGPTHLVVAPLHREHDPRPGLPMAGVFTSVEELAPLHTEQRPSARHLRLSNDRYLATTRPAALAAARARIAEVVRARRITHVVVFGGELAELTAGLSGVRVPGLAIPSPRAVTPSPAWEPTAVTVALDVCDSASLTASRALPAPGRRHRLRDGLDILRKARTEARFVDRFDLVTAINEADARAVEGPSRMGEVATVPNGLDDAYVRPLGVAGRRRGVVFWGNLAFGPNREALRFYLDEVHLPRLRGHGVELCVVGSGAPDWLVDLAASEPSVRLTGYVDDLPATVTEYPIMVNPMRTGSGMKNKVLEAFGLGLAVVSTRVGVDAFPEAGTGRFLVCSDAAAGLAQSVLTLLNEPSEAERLRRAAHEMVSRRYRWSTVGRAWADLVTGGDASRGADLFDAGFEPFTGVPTGPAMPALV